VKEEGYGACQLDSGRDRCGSASKVVFAPSGPGRLSGDWLGEPVNIGTLAAFVLVSIGIIVLRRTRPDLPRAFKVPGYPVVPILAAFSCFLLMGFLTLGTWVRFFVWMAVGLVVYFAYSRSHSRLARGETAGEVEGEEV
jgi:amino acid transporter